MPLSEADTRVKLIDPALYARLEGRQHHDGTGFTVTCTVSLFGHQRQGG